jgi:hypothetical protein
MSYPSPYQPPQPDYQSFNYYQQDFLAPARRAAILMFVIGGLGVAGAFCCGGSVLLLPQLMQTPEFAAQMERVPGATQDTMRLGMIVLAAMSFVAGLVFIILGAFVRRGSKGASIIAVVLAILSILFIGGNIVSALVMAANGPPQQIAGACVFTIPLALMILLTVWLFGAIKASDQAAGQRYAMQYWQYAQQQQMYGQYNQQAPPPPPPAGSSPS